MQIPENMNCGETYPIQYSIWITENRIAKERISPIFTTKKEANTFLNGMKNKPENAIIWKYTDESYDG